MPFRIGESTVTENTFSGDEKSKNKIAWIRYQGIITRRRKNDDPLQRLRNQFIYACSDKQVQSIVMDINSPGGEVGLTDSMHDIITTANKIKPVVAYIREIGASGGYYVACACREIVAQPAAIVGSIGVIGLHFNAVELLSKIGVKPEFFRSAKLKATGNPFEEMTEDARELRQHLLQGMFDRFQFIVCTARGIQKDQDNPVFDGRVFLAQEAKDNKLVDEIGYPPLAVNRACHLAGITDSYKVVEISSKPRASLGTKIIGSILGNEERAALEFLQEDISSLLSANTPMYLYTG